MQEIPHLKEMVMRLVEDADPEQIILFGSYARGEAGDQILAKAEQDLAALHHLLSVPAY